MIFEGIESFLGNTPMMRISRLFRDLNVFAKLEYLNPTFSIKDRPAYYMIQEAVRKKKIHPGNTVIAATSGNTGLGLCLACKINQLNLICTVFDSVSIEKIALLKSYGAHVVVCDSDVPSDEEGGYVWVAKSLSQEIKNSVLIDQFVDINNPLAHYQTTGPELYEQLRGKIDYFFSTIGTGGTISGIGRYLKEKNPSIKVIGVEPEGGIYRDTFLQKTPLYFDHLIHSISDNFISQNMDFSVVDDIISVKDIDSFRLCYELLDREQICAGTSSGCVLAGIKKFFERTEVINPEPIITTVLPDCGLKYIDTLFNPDYLEQHDIRLDGKSDDELRQQIAKTIAQFPKKVEIA